MDASGIVLMKKENGILTEELGSYDINEGLEFVFKAFVEDNLVNLYLSTDRDVTDEEFTDIFDLYDLDKLQVDGVEIEEIDDEYNPTWLYRFQFNDEVEVVLERLNNVISAHSDELNRIYEEIKNVQ